MATGIENGDSQGLEVDFTRLGQSGGDDAVGLIEGDVGHRWYLRRGGDGNRVF